MKRARLDLAGGIPGAEARKQARPAQTPIASAPSGPQVPAAGVTATSPATAPEAAPSTDGFRCSAHSAPDQASALEQQGKGNDAVKVYVRAARAGNGKAAKRLGEIYDKGLAGIPRDYAESLKWYNAARVLGEDVPIARGR